MPHKGKATSKELKLAITAIRLQNFMAFGEDPDAEWIELKPITLLFGRNSSGKSAIIRALRLLKQSLTDAQADSPFAFTKEDGVDVGTFEVMVHGHDLSKTVSFGFRFTVAPSWLKDFQGNEDLPLDENWVELTLSFSWNEKRKQAVLVLLQCKVPRSAIDGEDRRCIFSAERLDSDLPDDDPANWRFESDFFSQPISYDEDNIWSSVTIGLNSGFLPWLNVQGVEQQGYSQKRTGWGDDFDMVSALLRYFSSAAFTFFESIEYIHPIRPEPKRFFMLDDEQQRRWRQQGLGSYLKLIREELGEKGYDEVDGWLKKLRLGESLWPREQSKVSEVVRLTELVLDEGGEGVHEVNLVDVGFGASQVIPVVIQSLLAKRGSLVIIEQPELHLHPEAQAALTDLFVKMNSFDKRFLIETHSEHVLLRLQKRILQTTRDLYFDQLNATTEGYNLDAKHVQIVFVDRQPELSSSSKIKLLQIDEKASIHYPPPRFLNFFSQDSRDINDMYESLSALSKEKNPLEITRKSDRPENE